jgi:hypothetical protein
MIMKLRWILIPVVAVLAGLLALVIGLAASWGLRTILYPRCPQSQIVSNVCVAPWYTASMDAAGCFGAGFGAFLVLVGCVAVAPTHKRVTAFSTYAVGAAIALYIGFSFGRFEAMVTALLVGGVTTALVIRDSAVAKIA